MANYRHINGTVTYKSYDELKSLCNKYYVDVGFETDKNEVTIFCEHKVKYKFIKELRKICTKIDLSCIDKNNYYWYEDITGSDITRTVTVDKLYKVLKDNNVNVDYTTLEECLLKCDMQY